MGMKTFRNLSFLILLAAIIGTRHARVLASSCELAGFDGCGCTSDCLGGYSIVICNQYQYCAEEYPTFCADLTSACTDWCGGVAFLGEVDCDNTDGVNGCTGQCYCTEYCDEVD